MILTDITQLMWRCAATALIAGYSERVSSSNTQSDAVADNADEHLEEVMNYSLRRACFGLFVADISKHNTKCTTFYMALI